MAQTNERLDRLVLEARRSAEKREQGYRAQALKLFPWVCGRCARTFDHANLQLLEVHHKNNNHHDNRPDGSNWELLCTYCHENEHSKIKDMEGRSESQCRSNDHLQSIRRFEGDASLEEIALHRAQPSGGFDTAQSHLNALFSG